jgi:hypothetical protein
VGGDPDPHRMRMKARCARVGRIDRRNFGSHDFGVKL